MSASHKYLSWRCQHLHNEQLSKLRLIQAVQSGEGARREITIFECLSLFCKVFIIQRAASIGAYEKMLFGV